MSADTADAPSVDPDAIDDPDRWRELSRAEQSDALAARHQKNSGTPEGDAPDWDMVDNPTQQDTLDAIHQSLEKTWTAHAFPHTDAEPTIPFEMRRLTEHQQETLEERAQLLYEIEQAGEQEGIDDADELRDELGDEAAELFDDLDEMDAWLNGFLADITVGGTFTAEWWSDGENQPSGLRLEVFHETFERYAERMESAQSFRGE